MVDAHLSPAEVAVSFSTTDPALREEAWAAFKPFQPLLATIGEERVALRLAMLRPTPTDQGWRVWPPNRNLLAATSTWITSVAAGTLGSRPVLAAVGADRGLDLGTTVSLWDLDTAEPVGGPHLVGRSTDSAAVTAFGQVDGRDVMVVRCGTTAQLWDSPTPPPGASRTLPDEPREAAFGMLDGRVVWAVGRVAQRAGRPSTVQLWDVVAAAPVGSPVDVGPGQITAMAVGTIGGRTCIAVGLDDGTVRTWDAATRQPAEVSLSGLGGPVRAIALATVDDRPLVATSHDGRTDLETSRHQVVRLWDGSTGRPHGRPLTRRVDWTTCLAFAHRAGRPVLLTAGTESLVQAWDLTAWDPPEPVDDQGGVMAVALGAVDGRPLVAAGGRDGTIRLWDRISGQPVGRPLRGHSGQVWCVAFGTVGGRTLLASGSDDTTTRLWDVATGRTVGEPFARRRIVEPGPVSSVAFAQVDGRAVLAVVSDQLDLWDVTTGRRFKPRRALTTVPTSSGGPSPALLQLDGRAVLAAWHDTTLRLRDLETGRPVGDPLTVDTARGTTISGGQVDGRTVLATVASDSVQLWDATTGRPLGPRINPLVPMLGVAVGDGVVALGTEAGIAVLTPRFLADAGIG